MSIIIGGKSYAQLDSKHITRNWVSDSAKIKRNAKHMNPRTRFVRAIMLHTVHGTADGGVVEKVYAPGEDPSDADLTYAKYQGNTTREASWHFTVDTDGSIAQSYDPATEVTWHGNQCNTFTIGIELVQAADGDLVRGQLDSLVGLIDLLTAVDHPLMAIPRQIFLDGKTGGHYQRILGYSLTENGSGSKLCGIYGHRNVGYRAKSGKVMGYRGAGDPGDAPFEALKPFYERVTVTDDADVLNLWKGRQRSLGIAIDGIYGPEAKKATAKAFNTKVGQYVTRPIDFLL